MEVFTKDNKKILPKTIKGFAIEKTETFILESGEIISIMEAGFTCFLMERNTKDCSKTAEETGLASITISMVTFTKANGLIIIKMVKGFCITLHNRRNMKGFL